MAITENLKIENIFGYLSKRIKPIYYTIIDWINLRKSKNNDIKNIETVCLILGPYRNLTTFFSSILFLHPDCQVLNHAGRRVYGNKNIDFLSSYSTEVFDNFIRFSLEICSRGERGSYGGSILWSHAFESKILKSFVSTQKNKSTIKALVWKESLLNTNLIRSDESEFDNFLIKEKKIKFILPIRNPLDCAYSNIKTGHAKLFKGITDESTTFHVLEKVIDEIYWFVKKEEKFPNRFFYFFEQDISKNILIELTNFLNIQENIKWISNAEKIIINKSNYKYENDVINFYKDLISTKFYRFPTVMKKLKYFCQ
jgi:hypothetical protein